MDDKLLMASKLWYFWAKEVKWFIIQHTNLTPKQTWNKFFLYLFGNIKEVFIALHQGSIVGLNFFCGPVIIFYNKKEIFLFVFWKFFLPTLLFILHKICTTFLL